MQTDAKPNHIWHVRFFEHGKVCYHLREEYYQRAFACFVMQTGVEDNSDTREEVLIGLAKGLYYVDAVGSA